MPTEGCHGTEEWISGVVSDACPVMGIGEYNLLFQCYVWAKRGFLPTDWMSQPVSLMEGIDIIWQAADEEEIRANKARA